LHISIKKYSRPFNTLPKNNKSGEINHFCLHGRSLGKSNIRMSPTGKITTKGAELKPGVVKRTAFFSFN
jgi:hypothetical protein